MVWLDVLVIGHFIPIAACVNRSCCCFPLLDGMMGGEPRTAMDGLFLWNGGGRFIAVRESESEYADFWGLGTRVAQKWSKAKTKEKVSNLVLFDKPTYEKMMKEVPTWKLITPSILAERLRINGSLARQGLTELQKQGLIRCVAHHTSQTIYTRATNA